MNYQEYIPNHFLSPYIICYWSLETASSAPDVSPRQRIFPDGSIEMIFHYGDPFRKYTPTASPVVQPLCFVHGQLLNFMEVRPSGRVGVFSVRFQPFGFSAFCEVNAALLTGGLAEIDDIWGKEGQQLEEEMLAATDNRQRINLIEKFLQRKLKEKGQTLLIQHCVNSIKSNGGNLSVTELSDTIKVGKRQLQNLFRSSVGISPKMLSRIIRFQNTLRLLEQRRFSSLTVLGYDRGFYDQAHFIKDFKEFTGLSPSGYFEADPKVAKFFAGV